MLIPAMRYDDCDAAHAFLTQVLGLTEHVTYRDAQGKIAHCELSLGAGIMMFGPNQRETGSEFDAFMVPPSQTAGRATVSIYAVAPDVAARFARTLAAGAEILIPLRSEAYGGTSFTCRDPEGHVWTIGSYDPLAPIAEGGV